MTRCTGGEVESWSGEKVVVGSVPNSDGKRMAGTYLLHAEELGACAELPCMLGANALVM